VPEEPTETFPVVYVNFARITHGPLEFLLDFKRSTPEQPDPNKSQPLVRVILHPVVAKSFVRALEENFGEIPEPPHAPPVVH
jgi:hypothetical protein